MATRSKLKFLSTGSVAFSGTDDPANDQVVVSATATAALPNNNEDQAGVLTNFRVPGDAGNRAFHFLSNPVAAGFSVEAGAGGMGVATGYSSSYLLSNNGKGTMDSILAEPFTPGASRFRATARLHLPLMRDGVTTSCFIGLIIKDSAVGIAGTALISGISYNALTGVVAMEAWKIIGGVLSQINSIAIPAPDWLYCSINANVSGGLAGNPTCEFSPDRVLWDGLGTNLGGALSSPAKIGLLAGGGSVDFIDLTAT
jgi:hypothetical protein